MSPPADLRTECEEPRTRAQRVPDSSACSAVVRPPPEAERAKPLQMAQGNVHVRSPPAALRARTRCSARVCLALAPRQKNMMQVLLGAGAMAEDDLLSKLQECIELHQDAARRAKLKFVDNKEQDKATLDSVISVLNTQLDPLGLKVRATARVCPCGMSPCDMGTQACDMSMSPCDTLSPCDSGCMPTWQQDGSDQRARRQSTAVTRCPPPATGGEAAQQARRQAGVLRRRQPAAGRPRQAGHQPGQGRAGAIPQDRAPPPTPLRNRSTPCAPACAVPP